MGFWGTIVVARSDRPLAELDALRPLVDEDLWHCRGDDGWQALQMHRVPDNCYPPVTGPGEEWLTDLLTQTGHPVLAGVVLASDGGQVIGHGRDTGRWSGWVKLEHLLAYLDHEWRAGIQPDPDEDLPDDLDAHWRERYRTACLPLYELVPPAPVAAPAAVAWAREAGFAPDVAEVESVLAAYEVFAEEQVLKLARTLGVPLG